MGIYCSLARLCGRSDFIHAKHFIHYRELQPFLIKYLLFMVTFYFFSYYLCTYYFCINVLKTEIMVLNHMLLKDECPVTILSPRNVPSQNSEFKYIGSYSSKTNLTRETLKLITVSSICKIWRFTFNLQNSKIHLKTCLRKQNNDWEKEIFNNEVSCSSLP